MPANLAPLLWGWPHRFAHRMRSVGAEVVLLGPLSRGDAGSTGLDDLHSLAAVPAGFDGYVWTNRVERIGPALREEAP